MEFSKSSTCLLLSKNSGSGLGLGSRPQCRLSHLTLLRMMPHILSFQLHEPRPRRWTICRIAPAPNMQLFRHLPSAGLAVRNARRRRIRSSCHSKGSTVRRPFLLLAPTAREGNQSRSLRYFARTHLVLEVIIKQEKVLLAGERTPAYQNLITSRKWKR